MESKNLDAAIVAAIRAAAPNVKNGTYTCAHPKHGHFVVKLYTAQKGALAGKRILALQTGPNNETDFTGVAFWNDVERIAHVWTRYRGGSNAVINGWHYPQAPQGWTAYEYKLNIWCDLVNRTEAGEQHSGYSVQMSARCVRCNRELTHPESIDAGIGPECAGKK